MTLVPSSTADHAKYEGHPGLPSVHDMTLPYEASVDNAECCSAVPSITDFVGSIPLVPHDSTHYDTGAFVLITPRPTSTAPSKASNPEIDPTLNAEPPVHAHVPQRTSTSSTVTHEAVPVVTPPIQASQDTNEPALITNSSDLVPPLPSTTLTCEPLVLSSSNPIDSQHTSPPNSHSNTQGVSPRLPMLDTSSSCHLPSFLTTMSQASSPCSMASSYANTEDSTPHSKPLPRSNTTSKSQKEARPRSTATPTRSRHNSSTADWAPSGHPRIPTPRTSTNKPAPTSRSAASTPRQRHKTRKSSTDPKPTIKSTVRSPHRRSDSTDPLSSTFSGTAPPHLSLRSSLGPSPDLLRHHQSANSALSSVYTIEELLNSAQALRTQNDLPPPSIPVTAAVPPILLRTAKSSGSGGNCNASPIASTSPKLSMYRTNTFRVASNSSGSPSAVPVPYNYGSQQPGSPFATSTHPVHGLKLHSPAQHLSLPQVKSPGISIEPSSPVIETRRLSAPHMPFPGPSTDLEDHHLLTPPRHSMGTLTCPKQSTSGDNSVPGGDSTNERLIATTRLQCDSSFPDFHPTLRSSTSLSKREPSLDIAQPTPSIPIADHSPLTNKNKNPHPPTSTSTPRVDIRPTDDPILQMQAKLEPTLMRIRLGDAAVDSNDIATSVLAVMSQHSSRSHTIDLPEPPEPVTNTDSTTAPRLSHCLSEQLQTEVTRPKNVLQPRPIANLRSQSLDSPQKLPNDTPLQRYINMLASHGHCADRPFVARSLDGFASRSGRSQPPVLRKRFARDTTPTKVYSRASHRTSSINKIKSPARQSTPENTRGRSKLTNCSPQIKFISPPESPTIAPEDLLRSITTPVLPSTQTYVQKTASEVADHVPVSDDAAFSAEQIGNRTSEELQTFLKKMEAAQDDLLEILESSGIKLPTFMAGRAITTEMAKLRTQHEQEKQVLCSQYEDLLATANAEVASKTRIIASLRLKLADSLHHEVVDETNLDSLNDSPRLMSTQSSQTSENLQISQGSSSAITHHRNNLGSGSVSLGTDTLGLQSASIEGGSVSGPPAVRQQSLAVRVLKSVANVAWPIIAAGIYMRYQDATYPTNRRALERARLLGLY